MKWEIEVERLMEENLTSEEAVTQQIWRKETEKR
jgi:hypothetical protein